MVLLSVHKRIMSLRIRMQLYCSHFWVFGCGKKARDSSVQMPEPSHRFAMWGVIDLASIPNLVKAANSMYADLPDGRRCHKSLGCNSLVCDKFP